MTLREFLVKLPMEDLRKVVTGLRSNLGVEQPRQSISDTTRQDIVRYIQGRLNSLTKIQAANRLKDINQTKIIIQNPSHVTSAIALAFIPTDSLTQVAIQSNINVSGDSSSSAWGGLKSNLLGESANPNSKNLKHWEMIQEIVLFIGETETKPATISKYTTFCPTCEKDNPVEADHCIHCGLLLPLAVCPHCGTNNVNEAKFCMSCGQVR